MGIQLKANISKAIDNAINEAADDAPWDGYIHNELVRTFTQQTSSPAHQSDV